MMKLYRNSCLHKGAYLIFASLVLLSSSLTARADTEPEGTPLFSVFSTNNMWEENSQPGVEMTSLENPGGTYWKTWAFTHSASHYGLNCGIREVGTTATITSTAPVADKIGIVSAYIVYTGSTEYFNSVKLRVSSSADFSSYQEIDSPIHQSTADFWNFIIPEPAENLYYQLRVDFKPYENNWISIHVINFFSPDRLTLPEINRTPNADGSYNIVSRSGDLHLISAEYSADGEFVRNILIPADYSTPGVPVSDTDTSWRNKVASKNETFALQAPSTPGNYLKIRAKSVDADRQSDELIVSVSESGISSGVDQIVPDAGCASPVYYNLQGQKVEDPDGGVYIRLYNGRAEKVRL